MNHGQADDPERGHAGSPAPPPTAAAGWYPDAQMANTQRYWDGTEWTDDVAPTAAHAQSNVARDIDPKVWSTGLAFAYLFPPVGFCIGLTQINKKGGTALIGASVVAALVWVCVGGILLLALSA